MSNRHLARTVAMQILFEWDFNNRSQKLNEVMERNIAEFAQGLGEDQSFIERLVKGVVKNLDEIDKIIIKYAPEWPIEKITIIDRNVLRLGIYELIIDKQVPPKVAINESIEIAKTYGGDSSGRFVNGVLGAVYRDLEDKENDVITPETVKQEINKSKDQEKETKDQEDN